MTPNNILFTSAGRRVALLRLFREALARRGEDGQIVSADCSRHAPAHFAADAAELVPPISDPAYVAALLEICRRRRIRLLIPLIDTELSLLADRHREFEAVGTTLLVSSPEVNRICIDKRRSAEFFRGCGLAAPRIYSLAEVRAGAASFPLVVKPAQGSSSLGVHRVEDLEALEFFAARVAKPVIQELAEGREYTLDVLTDFSGKILCVVPRWRIATRAGEISKGMTVREPALIESGARLVQALPGPCGCLTVQCFHAPGQPPQFIEINPRFGGGFPLSAAAGADFPGVLLDLLTGRAPAREALAWKDGTVMLRFDDALFVRREDIQ